MILKSPYQSASISVMYILLAVVIGIAAVLVPAIVTLLWLCVIVISILSLVNNKTRYIWYAIAATPALEIWGRMAEAPFLPYEIGKYFLLFAILLCIAHVLLRKPYVPAYWSGWLILAMLLPSIIVGAATIDIEQWVFNLLGIVELAILLILAGRERWHVERFCKTLQICLLAIIAVLAYITVKVPVLGDIEFSLKANARASGGFGSNQVSSLLGMGMVLCCILITLRRPLFRYQWLNYLLLAYVLFRTLLTFSRGGLVVALLAIFILLLPRFFESVYSFVKYSITTVIMLAIGLGIFYKVNDITGNMLLLRYQGETYGTLYGSKEKSVNTILSGRKDIAASDIDMFIHHPVFGVGPGMSKKLRPAYGYDMDVAPHTEFTRLMSEHGIGGLFTACTLTIFPIIWVRRQNISKWKSVIMALFLLGILTTFHAAMRTNISVVCYVLAAIPVMHTVQVKKQNA